jgi:periplasmic protein TonB
MFEAITRPPDRTTRSRRLTTLITTSLAHVATVGALAVVPMLIVSPTIPVPARIAAFVVPQAAAPPPPPPPAPAPDAPAPPPVPKEEPRLVAPSQVPAFVAPEKPAENLMTAVGVPGGVEGGVPWGTVGGIVGSLPSTAPAPPPPPPPPSNEPVRVGRDIQAPAVLKRVDPVYPDVAKMRRLSGVVVLEVTVGTTGHVQAVKVLQSAGVFDAAAAAAVRQWQYSPLTLNGRPTSFVVTVSMQFGVTGVSS